MEDYVEKVLILTKMPAMALFVFEQLRYACNIFFAREVALIETQLLAREREPIIQGFQGIRQRYPDGSTRRNPNNSIAYLAPSQPIVLIGTIELLGVGHPLHPARRVILLEPQASFTAYQQAITRSHRNDAVFDCTALTLRVVDVPEEIEWSTENKFGVLVARCKEEMKREGLRLNGIRNGDRNCYMLKIPSNHSH